MSVITKNEKIFWEGTVTSVQPRIRLIRSFDERSHNYLGYVLRIQGIINEEERLFIIAVGKAAYKKHQFVVGDKVSGMGVSVANIKLEIAELYKISKLKLLFKSENASLKTHPWYKVAPELSIYRERGYRRLDIKVYNNKCTNCIWGCLMPVEMIIDHWNPSKVKYRTESFCYGPLSCTSYKAGPNRKVPGRKKGMVYIEEDWVDEDATAHRNFDE